jgi:hypothetical protein
VRTTAELHNSPRGQDLQEWRILAMNLEAKLTVRDRELAEAQNEVAHWKAQCQKGFNVAEILRQRDEARTQLSRAKKLAEDNGILAHQYSCEAIEAKGLALDFHDALQRLLVAHQPKPFGGITDTDELRKAESDRTTEILEATQHARQTLGKLKAPANTAPEDSQLAEALDHVRKAARIMAELGHTEHPISIHFLEDYRDYIMLKMEVSQLLQWKEKAIEGMPDYQAIGTELGLTIGTGVAPHILPAIIGLKQQRDALAEALESLMYGHEVKGEWEKCEQALAAVKGARTCVGCAQPLESSWHYPDCPKCLQAKMGATEGGAPL